MLPLQRDFVLTDLIRALDLFAAERLPDSSFAAITPPPAWMSSIVNVGGPGTAMTLGQAFPFLETFLSDAEAFWRQGSERSITSGLFTAAGGSEELLLRATALNLAAHCVLVLERLTGDADNRPLLQRAREARLEHEAAERRLQLLREPATALARLAEELLGAGLTGAQREVAERIGRESARVQRLIAGGG